MHANRQAGNGGGGGSDRDFPGFQVNVFCLFSSRGRCLSSGQEGKLDRSSVSSPILMVEPVEREQRDLDVTRTEEAPWMSGFTGAGPVVLTGPAPPPDDLDE